MRPNICVLSEGESLCSDVLMAEWKTRDNKLYSLCLYQSSNMTPIECWDNASTGKINFAQTIAKTTMFELRDRKSQMLLAKEAYHVISAQTKYQRPRRNPWSFF